MNIENITSQMRKGILEYCILSLLSNKDCYSSDLINSLKNSNMLVVEGTIYPLLTRLKNEGFLSYRWEESNQGPPRKYYKLTDKGGYFLNELHKSWIELVETVNKITNK
jgi:PadR family transcriptional regulator PadR